MSDSIEVRSEQAETGYTEGPHKLELLDGGKEVARLWIVPFVLKVGAARVRMDGIGSVSTDPEMRGRGYARRLLEACISRMKEGDAELAMLYGILNFYPKFGFATAGPEHWIRLSRIARDEPIPVGWQFRAAELPDMLRLEVLYDAATLNSVGAAVRDRESPPWKKLRSLAGTPECDCRVLADRSGEVHGYAWRGKGFWSSDMKQEHQPASLLLAEVIADGPDSAEALIQACRSWVSELSNNAESPLASVLISSPPEGFVARSASLGWAAFEAEYVPCGDSMARALNVRRLLTALLPELNARMALTPLNGSLIIESEGDRALLTVHEGLVNVSEDPAGDLPEVPVVSLSPGDFARFVLGAYPPEVILQRLSPTPQRSATTLLAALFPHRHPHMFMPDRY